MDTKNQGIYQSQNEIIIKKHSNNPYTLKESIIKKRKEKYRSSMLNASIKQESYFTSNSLMIHNMPFIQIKKQGQDNVEIEPNKIDQS